MLIEDIQKLTSDCEKVLTIQKPEFWKMIQNINSGKILTKIRKILVKTKYRDIGAPTDKLGSILLWKTLEKAILSNLSTVT